MGFPDITHTRADILPYVISFAFLFLIALAVLTWALDVWHDANACILYPNVWCADDWSCNTPCETGDPRNLNPCFQRSGTVGLASCLIGPTSTVATTCAIFPSGPSGSGNISDPACDCVANPQSPNQFQNCFQNCAQSVAASDPNNSQCCCCPQTPGCPWASIDAMPPECKQGFGSTNVQVYCGGQLQPNP